MRRGVQSAFSRSKDSWLASPVVITRSPPGGVARVWYVSPFQGFPGRLGVGIPKHPEPKFRFFLDLERAFLAIPMARNLAKTAIIGHYDGMKCDIEIFLDGEWRMAASFEPVTDGEVGKGIRGAGFLEYDVDYAEDHLDAAGIEAISCRYPASFELHRASSWPPFLLDILPAGANRGNFLRELTIPDGPAADWPLLLAGGGNPPGNLRIAQAAPPDPGDFRHAGFPREDVLERGPDFIEYARNNHAPVAGSSGAQGEAPKFLLTQDRRDRWHADGALPDELAARHWLVKFPRGKKPLDRDILRNEAAYYRVARAVGLQVGEAVQFENDALFVPRFDREIAGNAVRRLGLESLAAAGVTVFGARVPQERLCAAIARFSSDSASDIAEFVLRDVLNVAMGNTDNHPRNSALRKNGDGAIRLYDFAPMFLDDQGIPRACRWSGAEDRGMPEWGRVAELLEGVGMDPEAFRARLANFAGTVRRLPDVMDECGVGGWLIERLARRIEIVARSLDAARPAA